MQCNHINGSFSQMPRLTQISTPLPLSSTGWHLGICERRIEFMLVLLTLYCVHKSPGEIVKVQVLTQRVCSGA